MKTSHIIKIIILLILGIATSRCSHVPITEAPAAAANFEPPKYFVVEGNTRASVECPRSEKSWQKQNVKQLIAAANACVIEKNWPKADAIGEHLAGVAPQTPWGGFYMSVGSLGLERYPRSLWMIDLAIKKAPKAAFLHYQKGRVLWAMGEFELSVKAMDESTKFDSNFVDPRMFLAQIYFRDREYKKAKEYFSAVTRISASNPDALIGLAETQLALGDKKSAIAYFEKAIDMMGANLPLRLRVAEIYEGEKLVEQALHSYRRAKEIAAADRKYSAKTPELKEKIEILEKIVQENQASKKVSLRAPAESEKRSK